jgi:hypothetical protein
MPRDRVVLTREPDNAGRPEITPDQQAEYERGTRRGLIIVGIGALFYLAAAVLFAIEQWGAGIVVGVVAILISLLATRVLTRAARALETPSQRRY